MIIEIPASNEPESFICIVRRNIRIAGHTNNRLEQLIVVVSFLTKTQGCEDVTQVDVWLWKPNIAEFLEKVAGESEAEAFDLVTQKHREASARSVIMVEEVNPGEEIFCGAELLHEGAAERMVWQ